MGDDFEKLVRKCLDDMADRSLQHAAAGTGYSNIDMVRLMVSVIRSVDEYEQEELRKSGGFDDDRDFEK